uniref:Peptidase S1 domain-containing protein n=1 Tax=Equus caballus TaxID=9796 RepID=A0A5F5PU37_HORSE
MKACILVNRQTQRPFTILPEGKRKLPKALLSVSLRSMGHTVTQNRVLQCSRFPLTGALPCHGWHPPIMAPGLDLLRLIAPTSPLSFLCSSIRVILGAHDILNQERTWQVIPVKEAICHPDYIPSEYFNDIMILKLERKAMWTAAVWPLILPRGTAQVRPGEVCRVAGWRLIAPNGIISNALQDVELTVQQEQGDTGSPLICANVIQGIALGGRIDGTPPRVFIKLSRFLPWIKETMKCYEMPLSIGTSPPSLELIQNVTSN